MHQQSKLNHAEELFRPRVSRQEKANVSCPHPRGDRRRKPVREVAYACRPFCPRVERAGCPQCGVVRVLRTYLAQQCFGFRMKASKMQSTNPSALCRHRSRPRSALDATALLTFRRRLEANGPTARSSRRSTDAWQKIRLIIRKGTTIDATLIAAPPSTKNKDGKRDPETHQ